MWMHFSCSLVAQMRQLRHKRLLGYVAGGQPPSPHLGNICFGERYPNTTTLQSFLSRVLVTQSFLST
jgi:hypothetical protein